MGAVRSRRALQTAGAVLIALATAQFVTSSEARPQAGPGTASAPTASPVLVEAPAASRPRIARLMPDAANILFAIAHRTADASHADALFAARSWYTPPPPPPAPVVTQAEPTAPPLPFAFLGSYTDANDATVYFVTRDDRVYDVKPGDVIDALYSVAAVENGALVFVYKPLSTRQALAIGDAR
jgi:hypothetical protein